MAKYKFTSTIGELLKQNDLTIHDTLYSSHCFECSSRIYFNEDSTLVYPSLLDGTRMLVKAKCPTCGEVYYFELHFVHNHVNHTLRHLSTQYIHPINIKELTKFTGLTSDEILAKPSGLFEVYALYEKNYMLYHSYEQNLNKKNKIVDMYDSRLPLTYTALAIATTFCSSISVESFLISLDIFNEKCYNQSIESEVNK